MAPQPTHRRTPSRNERRQAAVHRRRQDAAHRTAAARKAARRRRRLKALAGVVAVAVVVTGVVFLLRDGSDGDPNDRAAGPEGAGRHGCPRRSPPPRPPTGPSTGPSPTRERSRTISTEVVAVQRPFDGRVAILDGEPPGGASRFEGRSTFGVYANYSEAGAVQAAADAPTVALGDLRLGASLDELVRQGLFVLGDRRRAKLGTETRECQTYRTGSPLQSLKITAPTGTDYVDVCLDSTGLILEELAVADGKPTQRLIATSLEVDAHPRSRPVQDRRREGRPRPGRRHRDRGRPHHGAGARLLGACQRPCRLHPQGPLPGGGHGDELGRTSTSGASTSSPSARAPRPASPT